MVPAILLRKIATKPAPWCQQFCYAKLRATSLASDKAASGSPADVFWFYKPLQASTRHGASNFAPQNCALHTPWCQQFCSAKLRATSLASDKAASGSPADVFWFYEPLQASLPGS